MVLLLIGVHRVLHVGMLGVIEIDISEFEEFEVRVLAVSIMGNALQASEQQGLAHHIQIGTQRIHDLHQVLVLIALRGVVVIGHLGEGVVQDLVESTTHQLLTYQVLQLVFAIFLPFDHQR